MVFWPIFDPKIGFLRFYPGKLRVITSKLLLIDSTAKNTSRKVYLESLAYRAENARKSFYYLGPFTEKTPYLCIFLSNLAFSRRKKNIWGTLFASGGRKKAVGGEKKEPDLLVF